MNTFHRSTLVALLLSAAGAAFAQTPPAPAASTPGVDARQHQQHQRIRQGVASGELTPAEAQRLRAEQRAIRRAEHQAKADGVVTPGERRHLQNMQDRAGHHIRHQKHDGQHRPAAAASAP